MAHPLSEFLYAVSDPYDAEGRSGCAMGAAGDIMPARSAILKNGPMHLRHLC